jgi:hypothetical protein
MLTGQAGCNQTGRQTSTQGTQVNNQSQHSILPDNAAVKEWENQNGHRGQHQRQSPQCLDQALADHDPSSRERSQKK